MKKLILMLVAATAAGVWGADGVRRIVFGDESRARVHYYDSSDPAKCFSLPAAKPVWDLQRLGTSGAIGRYRYVCHGGFDVVDLDARKTVESFRHPALAGVTAVSDLPDGGFLACVNPRLPRGQHAIHVIRFSSARQPVATAVFKNVFYARTMTRLANGEVLIAHNDGYLHGRLPAGTGTHEAEFIANVKMPVRRNAFHAVPTRAGDGYWLSAGYGQQLIRYEKDHHTVRSIWEMPKQNGLEAHFFSQISEMPGGEVYVANWAGHGWDDSKKGWQAFLFDRNGKVIWSLSDPARYGSTSGMVLVDVPEMKQPAAARTLKLVWQDDFNGTALDTSLWTMIPKGPSDWNRHMADRPDLVQVKDGMLELWGKVNTQTNTDPRPFVTGGVWTKGKRTMRCGKIEMRVKFEDHQKGAWPALWMCQNEKDAKGRAYPWGGEIDIVERLNGDAFVYHTVHSGWTLNMKHPNEPRHGGKGAIRQGDWNVYGIEVTKDALIWSVNGRETFRYARTPGGHPDQYPFDAIPYFLYMDMQLGGSWVGKVDVKTLPVRMWIDWVRAYEPAQ